MTTQAVLRRNLTSLGYSVKAGRSLDVDQSPGAVHRKADVISIFYIMIRSGNWRDWAGAPSVPEVHRVAHGDAD